LLGAGGHVHYEKSAYITLTPRHRFYFSTVAKGRVSVECSA
jgi:hypothetical protein